MAKSVLSVEQQTYAVQALACFDSPSVVAIAIKNDFGVVITPQGVECYDPNKRAGRRMAKKWRAIFEETRKTFLKDTSQIGISHRTVRLRAIQRMANKAETIGNMVLASSLLEQAAKEMGGSYTNRREHSGPNGGPIQTEEVSARERIASKLARLSAREAATGDTGEPE